MCGINGIVDFTGEGAFRKSVLNMNQALSHRGPDDFGVFDERGVALGHRRLSIIDLSSAGHQPMVSLSGRYVIVYNGELYNYREIRAELSDTEFRTSTDTEVIINAYEKWGSDCLSRFNGMFAFAIWDTLKREFFIARDRLGIKPLYYAIRDNRLIFSSELRGILASGLVSGNLSTEHLADYLRYQTVHAPNTILQGIFMLMPGTYMIGSEAPVFSEWWKPTIRTDNSSYAEACVNVRSLLAASVKRRLIADVPFGAFLSGGIDSSAIVALMREATTSNIKTFSVVFDNQEFSEAKYAARVAQKFETEHHEILLSPNDFLHDLPEGLDAMDHPSGDGLNTYVVSKATKHAGITMALSGLGGDELFAGYDIFRRSLSLERRKWLNHTPLIIRKAVGELIKLGKSGIASEKIRMVLALDQISFENFYPLSRIVLLEPQILNIINCESLPGNAVFNILRDRVKGAPDKNYMISRVSIAEVTTYMQNVLLRDADQMSMAHALEVRVPFLDYTLVDYCLSLPDEIKYPHTQKKLLVEAMGDLIPREIIDRPKMGFTFPWKHWMRNELRGFCEERLEYLKKYPQFNKVGIDRLWNDFLEEAPHATWSRLWPLVVLGHWLNKNKING